jgi:TonB-linked SusC/RagA family outer membrane protein
MLRHYKLNGCSPRGRIGSLLTCLVLLGFLANAPVHAAVTMQPRPVIMLDLKNVPLKSAIREIEKQTNYHFVMNDSKLQVSSKMVSGTIQSESIEEVLNFVLNGTDILYKIRKKQITLIPPGQAQAISPILVRDPGSTARLSQNGSLVSLAAMAEIVVTGTVVEEDGSVLPGVNVIVKGTSRGAVTDNNGKFTINVDSENDVLVFSFIGFLSQEVPLNGQTSVNVTLATDTHTLSEVVVVGYGTQEKKDVTGSIASVKGSDIENLPVASAAQSLQGRASGVNVVRSGGAPGNAGAIRVRGIGTINNADPLIIIDNVPASNINDVNPNDIESIEILKDASASAIYGTRAANGVVIVTTKRGKFSQPMHFTVNAYTGVSNKIKTVDVLSAPDLAMLKRERYTNDGLAVNPIWEDPQYQTQKTNWQDELLGRGTTNNLDVTLSGGGENSSFSITGGYYNEQGMIKNSFYKRYSMRINSDHKIGKRFKIGENLQVVNQTESAPNTLSAQDGLIWSAIRFNPGLPVKNPDGTYSSSQLSAEFGDINNPIFTVDTQDKNQNRTRMLGSLNGDLEIFKGFHLRANFGVDLTYLTYKEFNIIVNDQIRTNSRNTLTVRNERYYNLLQEYTANYNRDFGRHTVGFVGGFSVQQFNELKEMSQRRDFPNEDPSQRYLSAGQTITGAEETRTYDGLASAFGRINYDFNDRYLATVTFRADGSSKFADGNRWGNFPAFSLGWRISEEPFFAGLTKTISSLKLTGGWGQLGNQNISRLNYLALISPGYRYSFGDQSTVGSAQSALANPNISWETAEMTNFSIESGLLSNQILLTLNYFIKNTKDMLLDPPSLGSNGTARIPYQNVGQLQNKGLEIELSYRKTVGAFTYTIGGNASFINNKVQKLYDGNFIGSSSYGRPNQEITRTYEGRPMQTFYGWKTDGLYQNQSQIEADPALKNDERHANGLIQPGDVKFVDINGDGMIDDKDRTFIGSPWPKLTYGINASLGYRQFDLTMLFVGVGGVDIYNADRMQGIDPTYSFNMYAETINRWHGEGTSNSIPRMTTARDNLNHRTSDMFVEKGDFFRLKNLTLGYNFPQALSQSLKLTRARVYVTGQNIFVITKYSGMDPELGYADDNRQINVDYAQYPQARTFTVGATLTF